MNISVIIPVYNAEKYVTQAVESALQFKEVTEIILVEDKSPDNALQVCLNLELKHERVHVYQHTDKKNHGAGASRNLGIEKAIGDFIAFLDADDYYLPNRFEAEKTHFQNPEVEGVYGAIGVEYYTEKAKAQFYSIYQDKLDTVYKKEKPDDVFPGQLFLRGSFGLIHLDTLTIRKSALKKMNSIFNSTLRLHQDTEFTIRLSFYLKLFTGFFDQAIAIRGIHEENRITSFETQTKNRKETLFLMWTELKKWANSETSLSKEYKTHIQNMYRSFEIANAPLLKSYAMFLKDLCTNFKTTKRGVYNINYRKKLFPFL